MRLIDADALRKSLYNVGEDFDRENGNEHFIYGIETAIEVINYAPTVDPVEHGHWISRDDGYFHNCISECSECGKRYYLTGIDYNFCPRCGADMRGNSND